MLSFEFRYRCICILQMSTTFETIIYCELLYNLKSNVGGVWFIFYYIIITETDIDTYNFSRIILCNNISNYSVFTDTSTIYTVQTVYYTILEIMRHSLFLRYIRIGHTKDKKFVLSFYRDYVV